MSCASLHPCYVCFGEYDGEKWTPGDLRTFSSIEESFQSWVDSGEVRSKAKSFGNCVARPLLGESDSKLLLTCPPPALHLKLGLNHVLKKLDELWPEFGNFCKEINIVFEPYHGETLGILN